MPWHFSVLHMSVRGEDSLPFLIHNLRENTTGADISISFAGNWGRYDLPRLYNHELSQWGDPAQGTDRGVPFCRDHLWFQEEKYSLYLKLFHSLVPRLQCTNWYAVFLSLSMIKKNDTRVWGMVMPTPSRNHQHEAEFPFSHVTMELHVWESHRHNQSSGLAYMHGRRRSNGVEIGSIHPWKPWWGGLTINTCDLF